MTTVAARRSSSGRLLSRKTGTHRAAATDAAPATWSSAPTGAPRGEIHRVGKDGVKKEDPDELVQIVAERLAALVPAKASPFRRWLSITTAVILAVLALGMAGWLHWSGYWTDLVPFLTFNR